MSKTKTTKDFFEEWHPYDLLIRHNSMRHQEMIDCLAHWWEKTCSEGSSLLELGCGNAYVVSEALGQQSGLHYTGIDLSETALSGARQKLEGRDWAVELIEGDVLSRIEDLDRKFDCIVSGFSLHHFSPANTQRLLRAMKRLLLSGGVVIVYDIVTREDESRNNYLERLIAGTDFDGFGFSQSQRATVCDHIRTYDFPVSLSSWNTWADEAGFEHVSCAYRDPEEYYGFLVIR